MNAREGEPRGQKGLIVTTLKGLWGSFFNTHLKIPQGGINTTNINPQFPHLGYQNSTLLYPHKIEHS